VDGQKKWKVEDMEEASRRIRKRDWVMEGTNALN